ncbi:pyrroline-5-carboxylate reductase [Thioalkalivibrio sp. HK1]|uniref:pyrroline-5-carboxylate reductase n=1 Tax=Thioalkalivibrio sp. HK1 TaxID=1469245 RepID=UPI0004712D73|nr:pyrroline-5-carboxylate reductase [Thioalkalivibrio sp. HK1]
MSNSDIGFIGGGNMATSLIGGLIANGFSPETIYVSDPDATRLDHLRRRFSVHTGSDNTVPASCPTVVLAVKPQVMREVVVNLAPTWADRDPLLVSIAAGVRISDIDRWAGGGKAIVRTMPNTPALVGAGATGLFANERVDEKRCLDADKVLRAVGITLWVDEEDLLDAVTALSGSGPAYCFLLMEIMQAAGESMGLERDTAKQLTLQTALGAARIALDEGEDPATLRKRVTSPGGTTERAIVTMREGGIEALVKQGISAAQRRSVELGDALGEE